MKHITVKEVEYITDGQAASDGAGVKLTRFIGRTDLQELDPFLMLDVFESDNPNDYIAGFPPHPHRGFETVTYLLNGRMRHEDNQGHQGTLESGGVQWMTAGRGIIHSEMPEQENGLLRGIQLWINLPQKAKMIEPAYQEYSPSQLPVEHHQTGTSIRVISGQTDQGTRGLIENPYVQPTYFDVQMVAQDLFEQRLAPEDQSFLLLLEGELWVGDDNTVVKKGQIAVLHPGTQLQARTELMEARFLLISAQPLQEPIARGGPFVMNTQEELRQAFDDFRNNRF